jgi:hypothetical protein
MSAISDGSNMSDSISMTSSDDAHRDCRFHNDPREGLCHALTYAKKACKYKAKITKPDFLPVCQTHRHQPWNEKALRAGQCQATEECGRLCSRMSKYAPPFHFCAKHQNGNTVPCHLMGLPTELRLMIFRYLFPDVISTNTATRREVKVAILTANRQIYQEASSVLYGESIFQAKVDYLGIELQGREWNWTPRTRNDEDDYSANNLLGRYGASLIQNLEVKVELGNEDRTVLKGLGYGGITREDYEIFALRDAVRQLSALLCFQSESGNSGVLKRLTVKPVIHHARNWSPDQAIVALFSVLEPFQRLRVKSPHLEHPTSYVHPYLTHHGPTAGIKQMVTKMLTKKSYGKLEQQWLKAIKDGKGASSRLEPSAEVQEGFRKIEAFTQLIHVNGATRVREWTSRVFQHLERPLHIARVAYENDDMETIKNIQEAIKLRWVNAYRLQQRSLRTVADSINAMFERDDDDADQMDDEEDEIDDAPTPRELYPDAFEFKNIKLLEEPYAPSRVHHWTDLSGWDSAPPRDGPGVTTQISGLRLRIQKDGKEWMRLKTPAIVMQLLVEKNSQEL